MRHLLSVKGEKNHFPRCRKGAEPIMSSDRMMEYYYSMGQDCLTNGALDDAVTYFRKAANM